MISNEQYMKNLAVPNRKVDVVLDTDAYNEMDDQFAISYMLASQDKINTKAIYAAPFQNVNAASPKEGMEKSYKEILHLLELTGREDMVSNVYKGAEAFLASPCDPQVSEAVEDMVHRAMEYSPENPLYVIAIGAITNVASALLVCPKIAENIVIVWLGGNEHHYPDAYEFNMMKDIYAAQIIFKSFSPLIQVPARNVITPFTLSVFEVEALLKRKNELCDYLREHYFTDHDFCREETKLDKPRTRVLCDVCAVAWLLNDENRYMDCILTPRPILDNNGYYVFDTVEKRQMSCVYNIKRDAIACDMIEKIVNKDNFKRK